MMGSANPHARKTFEKEKEIVKNVVDTPTDGYTKYGVVQFGKKATVKIPLGDYKDEDELKKLVKVLPWSEEGEQLDDAIKKAGEELKKNGRRGSKKVLVVFFDGNDNSDKDKLKETVTPLKKDVLVVPVVLGDVDDDKVEELTPKDKKPIKGDDPKELGEITSEEIFNGNKK